MRNMFWVLLVVFVSGSLISYTRGQDNKTDDQRKAAMLKVMNIFDGGDVNQLDNYITKDAVDHAMDTAVSKKPGLEGVKEYFTYSHKLFPDMKTTVHSVAVSGDTLFAYFTSTGTTSEPHMGMPANKKIVYNGVDIVRFSGDKIAEHWGFMDSNDVGQMMKMQMQKAPKMMKGK